MPIKSRNWLAHETAEDFSGKLWKLVVTGEVELPQPMRAVVMRQIFPQDLEPSIVALEVIALGGDAAPDVMTWHKVGFLREDLTEPEYERALVFFSGEEIASFEVQIIVSAEGCSQ